MAPQGWQWDVLYSKKEDLDVQTVFKKGSCRGAGSFACELSCCVSADPKTFVPRKNHLGQVRNFGMYKYDEHGRIHEFEDDSRPGKDDEGGMAAMIAGMMRKSNKQLAKYSGEEALDTPEEQFVQVLSVAPWIPPPKFAELTLHLSQS